VPGVSPPPAPLEGVRILEYAQYVAGPLAGMLLADLGADVIKVESPAGDAYRRYAPFAEGESPYFYALNRNKRSVVLDLKTAAGREASRTLIAGADAVVHNIPESRAPAFGLDRESVRAANPRAVWCAVSALGADGPDAGTPAFDLVAQAWSGLLFAAARPGDEVPRRAGGIPMADLVAGLLATIAVLTGLVARPSGREAPGIEVSLLGAALAVQLQQFVSADGFGREPSRPAPATPERLAGELESTRAAERLEPYYRTYRAADGFFVLTCLNEAQRRATLAVLGLEDPFVANPQARPANDTERACREELGRRFEKLLAELPAAHWIRTFREAGAPAAEVRALDALYECPQAVANGLVQEVRAPGQASVRLLGNLFKVDGHAAPARRGVSALGEHNDEVLRA
jgi:crotonobetainyl-CoA:carnitine CoA-transferase CaiB-like acyl-CoA transferase